MPNPEFDLEQKIVNHADWIYRGSVLKHTELLHGFGVIEYTNGDKYVGEFQHCFKYGEGVYNYANGDKYHGTWVLGEKRGAGVLILASGEIIHQNHDD